MIERQLFSNVAEQGILKDFFLWPWSMTVSILRVARNAMGDLHEPLSRPLFPAKLLLLLEFPLYKGFPGILTAQEMWHGDGTTEGTTQVWRVLWSANDHLGLNSKVTWSRGRRQWVLNSSVTAGALIAKHKYMLHSFIWYRIHMLASETCDSGHGKMYNTFRPMGAYNRSHDSESRVAVADCLMFHPGKYNKTIIFC